MSHFTVLVIGPDHEAALAPFQENNMDDCPEHLLAFVDRTAELKEAFEKLKLSDDPEAKKQRKKYRTLATFAMEFYGYEPELARSAKKSGKKLDEIFNEHGRFGYWENPNAKWDWYTVGGRWKDFFRLKKKRNTKGLVSRNGTVQYADQALKKDIDFEGMRKDAERDANHKFDLLEGVLADRELPNWEAIKAKHGVTESDLKNIGAARKEYNDHPVIKDIWKDETLRYYTLQGIDEHFCGPDRAKYVAKRRAEAIVTFAVLKDGKWYENGKMGWWGITLNPKSDEDWVTEYEKLLDSLPDEALLTVVDCHI